MGKEKVFTTCTSVIKLASICSWVRMYHANAVAGQMNWCPQDVAADFDYHVSTNDPPTHQQIL